MRDVRVTEGSELNGMYVLTQAEINRLVANEIAAVVTELRTELRHTKNLLRKSRERGTAKPYVPRTKKKTYAPKTEYALDARRESYRKSYQKRRDRYEALTVWAGEELRTDPFWYRHLAKLEQRFAESKVAA